MAGSTGNRQKLPSSCQRNTIYSRKTILHLRYNKSFLFASQQICYKKRTLYDKSYWGNIVKLPSSWLKSLSLVAQNARIADVSLYENLRFAMFVSHTFD